jgi:Tol biopolymer transport system component
MQQDTRFAPARLEKILSSPEFVNSERMARFLAFLAARAQEPEPRRTKEIEIGHAVFDRPVGYDPKADSIVRVEATRLRKKLASYYSNDGKNDPVILRLEPGRYELEFVPNPAFVAEPEPPKPPEPSSRRNWILVAGAGVGTALIGAALYSRRTPPPVSLDAFAVTAFSGREDHPAFSPDGKKLAYVWDGDPGHYAVYVQGPNAESAARLTHSDLPEAYPVWSKDGQEIAFLRGIGQDRIEIRIHNLATGAEESVAELSASRSSVPGLSWSPDGQWLASAEVNGDADLLQLVIVSRKTREKRPFRPVSGPHISRSGPVFSRDGKRIAFVHALEGSSSDVYVADFPDGGERRLTFDNTLVRGLTWTADDRSLVIASYREKGRCSLWRVPLNGGAPERLTEAGSESWGPDISVAAEKLVFSRHVENVNIWRYQPGADPPREPWISSSGLNSSPRFSPDGKRVAFRSNRAGRSEIWIFDNGSNQSRRLTFFNGPVTGSPRWSPDGKRIAFDSRKFGNADIFVVPADGGDPQRFTSADSNEMLPAWSPDGEYIYYTTDREGFLSVWRKPAAGGPEQLVRRHATAPYLSPDGKYLYYARGANEPGLMRTELASDKEEPVLPALRPGMWGNWAIRPDGIYFVDPPEKEHGAKGQLQRLAPDGTVTMLAEIPHPVRWDGGLAVSPDGRSVLCAQMDRNDSDLYVISGFR